MSEVWKCLYLWEFSPRDMKTPRELLPPFSQKGAECEWVPRVSDRTPDLPLQSERGDENWRQFQKRLHSSQPFGKTPQFFQEEDSDKKLLIIMIHEKHVFNHSYNLKYSYNRSWDLQLNDKHFIKIAPTVVAASLSDLSCRRQTRDGKKFVNNTWSQCNTCVIVKIDLYSLTGVNITFRYVIYLKICLWN